jgi:hypothetical protein
LLRNWRLVPKGEGRVPASLKRIHQSSIIRDNLCKRQRDEPALNHSSTNVVVAVTFGQKSETFQLSNFTDSMPKHR